MEEIKVRKHLTKQEASDFFAELFGGEHHIPGEIKEMGYGWCVNSRSSSFATFDYNNLTRLVFLAHEKCIRAEIRPSGPGMLKLCIWQRHGRTGMMWERHPDIDQALEAFRKTRPAFIDHRTEITA